MRVTDLIPWKSARGYEPAVRSERDPIATLQNDVNRAFDDFLRLVNVPFSGLPASFLDNGSGIQVDVAETDKEVKVSAELPGLDEADVDVKVRDGTLIISGEKKTDREAEENGYILRERSFGRVERRLPLPDGIDADAAKASFKSGVLTVTIPKTAESQSSSKRIPVQSN
ncbi:Hsp20/alpha crystallin family protein [Rhizobium vallis]|uniref:Hsp20/alpha crystallin family protein n=1 Tax=Rhizobium vallis TaxID=634290 RepID=A0A3S0Y4J5_9HYPH|nr:Hsp20/alpha crystallin family protein [Rhizobium vallis]RUM24178.1 Hsp20/alpha crystallin family protein [Rhizobium vallis]